MSNRNIAKKLDFFSITPGDTARLPKIGTVVASAAPAALNALYSRIANTPETSGFFASQSEMAAARTKQIAHWSSLFTHGP